ncbi:Utp5p, partial [Ascoidea rubescens DSM 1968]
PIVDSSFNPDGSLIASAIIALDAHNIHIQSTSSSDFRNIDISFPLDKGLKFTCFSWGYLNPDFHNIESQVLFIGLNNGSILIYSPIQNQLIETLNNLSSYSIISCYYSKLSNSLWSIDLSDDLIEFNLSNFQKISNYKISDFLNQIDNLNNSITNNISNFNENTKLTNIKLISYQEKPHLLLSSNSVYLIDLSSKKVVSHFSNHINPIIVLNYKNDDHIITTAIDDRFINIYSLSENSIKKVLVTQSNVVSISFNDNTLIAVTQEGLIEVFDNPFNSKLVKPNEDSLNSDNPNNLINSTGRRKRHQNNKSNSAVAKIKLQRPASQLKIVENELKILNAFLTFDKQILYSWLENATIFHFDKLSLINQDSKSVITGDINIVKSKASSFSQDKTKKNLSSSHGDDIAASKQYRETTVHIASGDNLKDIEIDETENLTLADKLNSLNISKDISDFQQQIQEKKILKATTGSLTVVLTQALKTNDHSLLESILNIDNEQNIKTTILRLNSSLVIILLNKLSERLARLSNTSQTKNKRLIIWIKWVLIIHGSYLIRLNFTGGNGSLLRDLSQLNFILGKKAANLNKLLILRSKLDLILEQISIKKEILSEFQQQNYFSQEGEENESDVEYNEALDDAHLIDNGEEDYISEDDEESDDYYSEDESDVDMEEEEDDDD